MADESTPPQKKQKVVAVTQAAANGGAAAPTAAPAAAGSAPADACLPAGDGIPWQKHGHDWIGRRARRIFPTGPSDGRIVAWAPEDGDDQALWRMAHWDGDGEVRRRSTAPAPSAFCLLAPPRLLLLASSSSRRLAPPSRALH